MSTSAFTDLQPRVFSRWVKFGLPVGGLALLWFLNHEAPLVFTSLMLSWGLCYVLGPLVDLLERLHIRRGFATATVLISAYVGLFVFFTQLISVTRDLRSQINPETVQANLKKAEMSAFNWIGTNIPLLKPFMEPGVKAAGEGVKVITGQKSKSTSKNTPPPQPAPVEPTAADHFHDAAHKQVVAWAPDIALALLKFIPNLVLIPYFTFFFLKDGRALKQTLIEWLPNRYFEPALKFLYEMDRRLRSYLVNTFIDCALVGTLVGVGCKVVGTPYPLLFGVIAFTFNTIPLLGPLVYGAIGIFLCIAAGESMGVITGFALVFILSRVCDDLIFTPTIFGKSHDIHPVVVVCAILIGETVAGAWGMFLAIPLVSILWLGIEIVREISLGENIEPLPSSAFKPFA